MTNTDKVYVNSIFFEEKVFTDGGSILKANITVDELIKFLKDNKSADGKVKLVISKKKTIVPNKSTHYAYLDTWAPSGGASFPSKKSATPAKSSKPISQVSEPEEQLI